MALPLRRTLTAALLVLLPTACQPPEGGTPPTPDSTTGAAPDPTAEATPSDLATVAPPAVTAPEVAPPAVTAGLPPQQERDDDGVPTALNEEWFDLDGHDNGLGERRSEQTVFYENGVLSIYPQPYAANGPVSGAVGLSRPLRLTNGGFQTSVDLQAAASDDTNVALLVHPDDASRDMGSIEARLVEGPRTKVELTVRLRDKVIGKKHYVDADFTAEGGVQVEFESALDATTGIHTILATVADQTVVLYDSTTVPPELRLATGGKQHLQVTTNIFNATRGDGTVEPDAPAVLIPRVGVTDLATLQNDVLVPAQ